MNGTDALLRLTTALDAGGIPYMIVGSYSSNFYGIPRSTKDADLVVHLPSSGWAILPSLLPQGIHMEAQMGFEMVTSTRKELLRVADSLFEIELFHLSDDAHDQSRFSRRRQIEIFPGSTVWLPSPEDVIIQKLRWSDRAKRSKDFADAIAVMQVQGKRLDWPYIEEWCRQHGTLDILAEAKTEAAPAWED
jgi:hypothetical protein